MYQIGTRVISKCGDVGLIIRLNKNWPVTYEVDLGHGRIGNFFAESLREYLVEDTSYNVEDGIEVDILKALAHKQISLGATIEVLGGIKWDRNNTKEKQKNV